WRSRSTGNKRARRSSRPRACALGTAAAAAAITRLPRIARRPTLPRASRPPRRGFLTPREKGVEPAALERVTRAGDDRAQPPGVARIRRAGTAFGLDDEVPWGLRALRAHLREEGLEHLRFL